MPRFFFDIHDDELFRDEEGVELAGLDQARAEGARVVGEAVRDNLPMLWRNPPLELVCRDAEHRVLFRIVVSTAEA